MNPQPPSGKEKPPAPAVNMQLGAGLSAESLRAQLEKILSSTTFGSAQRLSRFLRYTVELTLQGRGDQIKEYRLGLEVFDRNQSYDPRIDPIVRVEAGRLRSKLKAYYEEEGRDDPILISYPKGTYVPVFQGREPSVDSPTSHRALVSFLRERKVIPLFLVLAMAGTAALWLAHRARTNSSPQREQELHRPLASVALLPFESLSSDPKQGHFADGMTEALLHGAGGVGRCRPYD
jgi:adenylate cyclase